MDFEDTFVYAEEHYYDEPEEDYYSDEPTPVSFCDNYQIHDAHYYTAINTCGYFCHGFSAADLAAVEAAEAAEPCEHGLSAHLCNGPNHYETYEQERMREGY